MIGYVMVGTNNLDKAIIFYDEVLKIINLTRKDTDEVCAGYTQNNSDGSIEFYVTKPANKKTATFGNGTQVSFLVSSREIVDKFHEIALKPVVLVKEMVVKDLRVQVFTIHIFVI